MSTAITPAPPSTTLGEAHASDSDRTDPPGDASTMRAVVHDTYGSADVLQLATIDRPGVGERDVLVRVHAAGLDRGTWHLMVGKPYLLRLVFGMRGPKQPVPGHDVAGTVAAIGSAVTSFAVGDHVYGFGNGTFAEYTVAREDKLAIKPTNVRFEQAAAVPVSAGTALAGPRRRRSGPGRSTGADHRRLRRRRFATRSSSPRPTGQKSPASAAPQSSTWSVRGARTASSTTPAKTSPTVRERYDLILDIAGIRRAVRLRRALTPSGTLVLVGGEQGGDWTGGTIGRQLRARLLSLFVPQRLTSCIAKERGSDAERLTELIESQPGDPEHRPDLPTRRGTRRHAPPRSGPGSRQGRHHHHAATRATSIPVGRDARPSRRFNGRWECQLTRNLTRARPPSRPRR